MPVGVRVNGPGQTATTATGQNPATAVLLNNTFYNNGVGIRTEAPTFNGNRTPSRTSTSSAMDNIFDGGTIGSRPERRRRPRSAARRRQRAAVQPLQQLHHPLRQPDTEITGRPSSATTTRSSATRSSSTRPNGNFFIQSGSAAIDAGLSELGPVAHRRRALPDRQPDPRRQTAASATPSAAPTRFGGLGIISDPDPREIVTLPGTPGRSFVDQFSRSRPAPRVAIAGPATERRHPSFVPIGGERDLAGLPPRRRPERPPTSASAAGPSSTSVPASTGSSTRRTSPTPAPPTSTATARADGVFATVVDPTTAASPGQPLHPRRRRRHQPRRRRRSRSSSTSRSTRRRSPT